MKHFLFLLFALPLVLVSCNPDEDDSELSGCMDPDAVNFNANATVDDGSCVYGESSGCGGVSTVTYDGYTYALQAIGDQCWFAENLRNEHYANGDVIPGELTDGEWSNTTNGAMTVYGEGHRILTTVPNPCRLRPPVQHGMRWLMREGCVQAVGTSRRMGSLLPSRCIWE